MLAGDISMGIIMEHFNLYLFSERVENSLFPLNYAAPRYTCEKFKPLKISNFTLLWDRCITIVSN